MLESLIQPMPPCHLKTIETIGEPYCCTGSYVPSTEQEWPVVLFGNSAFSIAVGQCERTCSRTQFLVYTDLLVSQAERNKLHLLRVDLGCHSASVL